MWRPLLAWAIVLGGCSNTAPVLPPIPADAQDAAGGDSENPGVDLLAGPKSLRFVITADDHGKNCVGQTSCGLILSYFQAREVAVRVESGGVPVPGVTVAYQVPTTPTSWERSSPRRRCRMRTALPP